VVFLSEYCSQQVCDIGIVIELFDATRALGLRSTWLAVSS
jgi:hypothetical protein